MIILGVNIVIISCALLGGILNWLLERKINWKNLMSSLWLGGVTFCYWDSPFAYVLAFIVGFLSCRYVNKYVQLGLKTLIKRHNMKRWGKFIHRR